MPSAVSYGLLFLDYILYAAWSMTFDPLIFIPILACFIMFPGVVLFFVGCCVDSWEVQLACFGGTVLCGIIGFTFLTLWFSSVQVI